MKRLAMVLALVAMGACQKAQQQTQTAADTSHMMMADTSHKMMADTAKPVAKAAAKPVAKKKKHKA